MEDCLKSQISPLVKYRQNSLIWIGGRVSVSAHIFIPVLHSSGCELMSILIGGFACRTSGNFETCNTSLCVSFIITKCNFNHYALRMKLVLHLSFYGCKMCCLLIIMCFCVSLFFRRRTTIHIQRTHLHP